MVALTTKSSRRTKVNNSDRGKILKRSLGALFRQGQNIENCSLKHLKISGAQARYMDVIHDSPGISQDAVARLFKVDKGAVARAVKKLETAGYIERRRKEGDSRAWQLFMTERGEEIHKMMSTGEMEFESRLLAGFSEEEIDTLCMMLDRVADNIAAMHSDAHGDCERRCRK